MQLLALALYHRDRRPESRVLRFRPGALNILTGESETGKSEVLDIVEYCLGRSVPGLPDEPIDQTIGWYALLVSFGDQRMVVARPRPTGASTTQAMIRTGDRTLQLPRSDELVVNADTSAVRKELSARLGIEDFRFQPPAGSSRHAFDVSVAQAALLCFQNQNEIDDKATLFHRQTENGIAQAIKDTLPYFLGAAGPEQALRRYHFGDAQRAQRAAHRKLEEAMRRQSAAEADELTLLRLARTEGLLADIPLAPSPQDVRALLQRSLQSVPREADPAAPDDERTLLNTERRVLRQQLQELEDSLAQVKRWQKQEEAFSGELHLQLGRLKTLDLLGPEAEHAVDTCPMCAQPLLTPDTSAAEIVLLTEQIAEELSQAQAVRPIRDLHRRALEAQREAILGQLRTNGAQLRELSAAEERMRALQDQYVRAARVQGRIEQALSGTAGTRDGDLSRLRNELQLAQEAVSALQVLIDEDDVTAETERRLAKIGVNMTSWAKRLNLGQAANADEVSISLTQLNVVVRRSIGRLPLNRIGSAKNWIGYHLVAHLALHTYFRLSSRPVPSFLMLDQPTQAFFPEKIKDASTVEDADWATVTAYFELLRDVVAINEGKLQIIVCDHANLTEHPWFQESVVENWRPVDGRRNALIPPEWLA
ncbi:DUF3732 domain-containing protein [Yinghuangia sp. ASG 101]|uniref:DUF3732 domain-containing protein n=1 Tax=Yinghuangia sp. ASG 101 TaxID=2896848 RepID=UPI001E32483B|nr:DUF3732 domain-containing protein [Yinghuangia sp. ASG 101]UGQ13538.1 DUF3732 domain-containing protein [Yinghuangia sp. ASG 101]